MAEVDASEERDLEVKFEDGLMVSYEDLVRRCFVIRQSSKFCNSIHMRGFRVIPTHQSFWWNGMLFEFLKIALCD